MEVSIIIPTYNGAHKLPSIIEALAKQVFKEFEVIIAVDGSTDNTMGILAQLEIRLPKLKVIYYKNQGRSVIRNNGAAIAAGDLLIFFDDDMYPLSDCIQKHVQHHTLHPGTILTGGLSEESSASVADIVRYKSYLSNKWNSRLKKSITDELSKDNVFVTAANFSIQKSVFEKLGGFDARLNDAEDFDFAVRAFKAGIPLYFKQDVFAWHNDLITCKSYIKRQRQYTLAHKQLAEMKPWLVEEGFIKPVKQPSGLRGKIYQFFLSQYWVRVVDNGGLKMLPKILRYKAYDLIITANGIFYPEKVRF